MNARSIACALALAGALLGCVAIVGGTDGYQLADNPQPTGCTAAADCDAGEVCCLSGQEPSSTTRSCQSGPCAIAQLCKTNMECGDSAPGCSLQACEVGGTTFTLQACGALPPCSFR